jgi:chemotaxis protein MotC
MTWSRSAASLLAALPFMAATALAGPPDPVPDSGEPYELVRSLQAAQDDIANGNADAHSGHLALIRQIGEKFLSADAAAWSNPRNGQAVIVFMLSGGAPQIVRKLPRDRLNVDERLFNGALAYVEGRQDEAKELLKDINPRAVPSSLSGQLALVQGALLSNSDPSAAIERLDEARLLLPGTLVEEAALRREILLVGQAEDFDKLEFLTLAYLRHYRRSVYAGDFWQRFSSALTRSSLAMDESRFPRISGMTEQLDRANRLKLYLAISRIALVRGRLAVARLAGEQALLLSSEGMADRERAHLFRGTARALTDDYEGGMAELTAVDRARLPERDAHLLNAALQLALDVRKPVTGPPTGGSGTDNPPPTPARLDLTASSTTLARAQKHLAELEQLTKDRRP